MLLELQGIKKYFPVKKGSLGQMQSYIRAVDGVDLSVRPGENLGLVGESGSGKSTLAKMILKIYSADAGRVLFENQDITRPSPVLMRSIRRNVQMVFQDPYSSLDPRYTILKILEEAFHLVHREYPSRVERITRIREILGAVHLPKDILDRYPHEFSGGERQRIAIARALVLNPKLLILDEAVSSLDVIIQQEIISLLKELQQSYALTYIFISHNLKVIQRIAHRIAVMYQGKIVEVAAADELFKDPLHDYTRELLDASVHYRAMYRERPISLEPTSRLIDRGQGHYVRI